jgi:dipeptidyl aminopeptidase/acylaminoacyl peptidase
MAGMTPEGVLEMTAASDPRVSPDGSTIAYTVWRIDGDENEYRSAIWVVAADGSSAPRQLTAGSKRDATPRWSPDGTQLAFTSSRDVEKMQLYVLPLAGGEARKLTELKESVTDPRWSPDGTRIAFTARVPDEAYEELDEKKRAPRRFTRIRTRLDNVGWIGDRRQHVYVVSADGSKEARQLTDGDRDDGSPAWSPDGKRIAFASSRHQDWDIDDAQDIYVMAADGTEPADPRKLTATDGSADSPSWSPDGSRIAYQFTPGVWDIPRHTQIAVMAADGSGRTVLTQALDRNCNPYPGIREPLWDEDSLVFAVEDHGNNHLYRVATDGSPAPELVEGGDRMITGYDVVGGVLAYTATTPTALDEVFVGDKQLTEVGEAFAEGRDLQASERFTAVSKDGTEVEAWIVKPAGFEEGTRYPVVFNIHGGPFTQYGNRFFDETQVYTGAGYAVVYSNPRGSSGYSEAWGRAIRGPGKGADGPGMGTVDVEDMMAVIETALDRYGSFCDRDRVAVIGGSYGGWSTSWLVGHTDMFKAAVSERAVNQWVSFWGSSDIGPFFRGYFGTFVFEDVDSWLKVSPASYATNIHTPLLILHSENDFRAPIEQGEHLFVTLRLLKREVEMVRFPNESHELSRSGSPAHRVQRFLVILEWFDRHLKPSQSAAG